MVLSTPLSVFAIELSSSGTVIERPGEVVILLAFLLCCERLRARDLGLAFELERGLGVTILGNVSTFSAKAGRTHRDVSITKQIREGINRVSKAYRFPWQMFLLLSHMSKMKACVHNSGEVVLVSLLLPALCRHEHRMLLYALGTDRSALPFLLSVVYFPQPSDSYD